MLNKLPIVGVMGSGTQGHDALAIEVGAAVASLGAHLLTGGGAGVMTTVSKGFTQVEDRRGQCIGIIPTDPQADGTFKARDSYPNPYVEIPVYTPLGVYAGEGTDFISRNFINIMTAHVIMALPGSGGTKNELNLAAKFGKPVCMIGPHDLPADFHPQIPRFTKVSDGINWLRTELGKVNP